jgi:putative transposase
MEKSSQPLRIISREARRKSVTKTQAQPKKERKPKNPNLGNKAYKFRISPTQKQSGKLEWILRRCKELYNAALEERREAYRMNGVSVSYQMQANQLPAIKELREEYQDIHSQVQQEVLKRLEKAMQAFFRRVRNGETPGYPRFKSGDRYDSFTYPQGGYEIIKKRLHLSKIGHIKIKLHREMKGTIKTCTIKREGDQWYAVLTTEYEFDPSMTFHPSEEEVGIDLGINSFAALSDGTFIENPHVYRTAEEEIKAAHKKIARRKKGSHRRNRAKKELSRLYRKARNKRRDFLHKQSHNLVKNYGTLVFEELHIDNMTKAPDPKQDEDGKYLPNGAAAKGGLNKSILDAGWGAFVTIWSHKAAEAGGKVVKVAPHGTSQACSGCGCVVPKDLGVRWHSCPHCGCELDRDHNAARNILHRCHLQKQNGAGSVPQRSPRGRTVEAPGL